MFSSSLSFWHLVFHSSVPVANITMFFNGVFVFACGPLTFAPCLFLETDPVAHFHAAHHVPEPGVCHQQVWRSTLPPDKGVKVRQVPGIAHTGTCMFVSASDLCRCLP